MIDFLSNSDWLRPQIDFLLLLQNLRIAHFSMFNDLFLSVTIVGEFWLPLLICAIFYWCIDMKSGIYLFSLSTLNMFFSHLFKMIACVYRPWVLSDKIHPVNKALALAAGYSFPSGHSAQASATLGGLAFLFKKRPLIAVLIILFVFIVGFSRMWLGVHTPQDVVVGLFIGFSLVFILNYLIEWAEKDKNRYLWLFFGINTAVAAVLIFLCYLNNYPIDYVNGKVLVDPRHALQVSIFCYGCIAGVLSGVFLCRRYFPYNPQDVSLQTRIYRGVVGGILEILLYKFGIKHLFCNECDFKIVYILSFISGFFITAIYPLMFQWFEKLNYKKF